MSLSKSGVPYLDFSWGVISGCNGPVNIETGRQERCPWCYLSAMRTRYGQSMDPVFRPERLADPLRCRKPAIIGLLGGDLFDPAFTDEEIAAVYGVMAATPQHTYIIPTKQAARMDRWFGWLDGQKSKWPGCPWDWQTSCCAHHAGSMVIGKIVDGAVNLQERWPLPNVWNGVSVTNQSDADLRIEYLLRTPAAHRFVSVAPMQGPVDMGRWMPRDRYYLAQCEECGYVGTSAGWGGGNRDDESLYCPECEAMDREKEISGLDAVIVEGQSGPQAVPLDLDWVRAIRDQCQEAGVAFAWKQGSGLHPEHEPYLDGKQWPISGLPWMRSAT